MIIVSFWNHLPPALEEYENILIKVSICISKALKEDKDMLKNFSIYTFYLFISAYLLRSHTSKIKEASFEMDTKNIPIENYTNRPNKLWVVLVLGLHQRLSAGRQVHRPLDDFWVVVEAQVLPRHGLTELVGAGVVFDCLEQLLQAAHVLFCNWVWKLHFLICKSNQSVYFCYILNIQNTGIFFQEIQTN